MGSTLPITCLAVVLSLSICAGASAEPAPTADSGAVRSGTARAVPDSDFSLQGGNGLFVDLDAGIGSTIGGGGLYRSGPLDVGGAAELGTQIFGYSYAGLSCAVGFGVRTASDVRVDALAELGGHGYVGVGTHLFSADPGTGGAAPFIGGRLLASYALFHGPRHLTLGLEGSYENDLSRRHVSYDYMESGWFGDADYTEHADHVVGTQRIGLSVRIGGSFDVQ